MVYDMKNAEATEEERKEYIRKRVKDFFDEEYFSTPAIPKEIDYQPGFGDQVTWLAVKNDKNAVGFSYLLGKEKGRRVAYSKLKDQVIVVGNFGG